MRAASRRDRCVPGTRRVRRFPALQDEGWGRLPPPELPRGDRRCLCAGPGLPELVLVSLPAQEPRGGRAGAPAGAGGEQLPSRSRGLKNSPVGPERPPRGGATSRLLVTGTGTGSGAGGQAAAPASRGRGRRPAGSARRWSRRAGWGQPVAAPVAVAPRCLYEPMAGGPCWTPPSPARPRRFAAPAGPVPARRGHQDGSALPSFTCDTPRQLSAASAAALPASAARGMPGGPGKEPPGPGTGRGRPAPAAAKHPARPLEGPEQNKSLCGAPARAAVGSGRALVVLKCGGCLGTQRT